MWGDPAVYDMIGGKPFSREESWQRLLRYIGHWPTAGYGTWTIRETATSHFVGEIGLMDSRRATEPSFEGTPEAGWALASWAHRRGFAGEALGAMLAWADGASMDRTVCIVAPTNLASIRLASRWGYRTIAQACYRGSTVDLYERVRADGGR